MSDNNSVVIHDVGILSEYTSKKTGELMILINTRVGPSISCDGFASFRCKKDQIVPLEKEGRCDVVYDSDCDIRVHVDEGGGEQGEQLVKASVFSASHDKALASYRKEVEKEKKEAKRQEAIKDGLGLELNEFGRVKSKFDKIVEYEQNHPLWE